MGARCGGRPTSRLTDRWGVTSAVPFTRKLSGGELGIDVEGVGRALCRVGVFMPLRVFNAGSREWRRTYGWRKERAVNKLRKAEGWKQNGEYTPGVHQLLIDHGGFDERAASFMQAYRPPDPPSNAERIETAIADFCTRAERNEGQWHYTQRRPFSGLGVVPEREHWNDCSSYAILAYYWASTQTGLRIPDPSGYAYRGWGNTGDNLDGHPRVSSPFRVGDLAHYEGHVTICRRAGTATSAVWSSFGQERGPYDVNLHYRHDLLFVVRPGLA